MNHRPARRSSDPLARVSARVTAWMLGLGLLSLHATVFTVAMIGLVIWNIYDSPADLWVGGVLWRWGFLLAFHALAVAVGWMVWKLLRAEQRAIDAAHLQATPPPQPLDLRPVTTWQLPPRPAPAGVQQNVAAAQRTAAAKQIVAASVAWSGDVVRGAGSALTATANRLSSRTKQRVNGQTPASTTATYNWPEGPIRPHGDEPAFGPAPANGTPRPTGANAPGVNGFPPAAEGPRSTSPSVEKEAGKTWVETATGGWLAPKDPDQVDGVDRASGRHGAAANGSPHESAGGDGFSPQ